MDDSIYRQLFRIAARWIVSYPLFNIESVHGSIIENVAELEISVDYLEAVCMDEAAKKMKNDVLGEGNRKALARNSTLQGFDVTAINFHH